MSSTGVTESQIEQVERKIRSLVLDVLNEGGLLGIQVELLNRWLDGDV